MVFQNNNTWLRTKRACNHCKLVFETASPQVSKRIVPAIDNTRHIIKLLPTTERSRENSRYSVYKCNELFIEQFVVCVNTFPINPH